jgi:protein gp37
MMMAENSKIEWTDHTFNPWIGCTRVSPACDHCYAAELMDTRYHRVTWGPGEARVRTSASNWKQPLRWNREAAASGRRPTVFCASLADVVDVEVDPLWRYQLFELIEATPNLIWLLLTKRIGNAERMCRVEAGNRPMPHNAALGATMANQQEWQRDSRKLEEAAHNLGPLFTFASVEPMLSRILMDDWCPDWVICGGESGRGARDMPEEWPADLKAQTAARGKAFFMKQMAKRAPIPTHLMLRQFPAELAA